MSQDKAVLQILTRPENKIKLQFENLIIAMKNDLFKLNITNDAEERVYVADVDDIEEGIKVHMTDGTEFKLIRG